MRDSDAILAQLCRDDAYLRKVIPFLRPEYFEDPGQRLIFERIASYVERYRRPPGPRVLVVEVGDLRGVPEKTHERAVVLAEEYQSVDLAADVPWLVDRTEKFCRERALYLAMTDAITVMEGRDPKRTVDSIPESIKKALAVSFDTSVGHDFWLDAERRWESYHRVEAHIPFVHPYLNDITKGGATRKTLNVLAAATNSFKTGMLCDLTAGWVSQGQKVLYVTMEMAEERISERVEANLLQRTIDSIKGLAKGDFMERIQVARSKFKGELVVREYPTGTANVNHVRALLSELEVRRGFVPDVIVVDYLSICACASIKQADNMYLKNKTIAEELRGLAVERDVSLWTAAQLDRKGNENNSDPGLGNVAESKGISDTADFMLAIVLTEELEEKNMILLKQLKNRYDQKSKKRRHVMGVDFGRMTLYEIEDESEVYKAANTKTSKAVDREVSEAYEVKPSVAPRRPKSFSDVKDGAASKGINFE